ncbi:hypothetical protein KJ359_003195 [Pestalotiopsis sp. 9143b]|nr:hypothetical protein KJ359_003195 [Pestalotiopsis sp. 9143b]
MALGTLLLATLVPLGLRRTAAAEKTLPEQAQIIDQKSFAVLETVPPPSEANASTIFVWPGVTEDSLTAKPFHIYTDEFYDIIGENPALTLLAEVESDPIFHEAVVWYPPTDEVFFVQNAGAPAAGTGLNKSAIIEKISLADAAAVANGTSENVTVTTVNSNPQVINPNGATYHRGNILYMGEGMGDNIGPSIYLMNPVEPYNTTVLLNNYFGRQFNALNDVGVNPRNKDIYFTDPTYGYVQDFRPAPGLPNQVYRFNETTGAVTTVADGFVMPNGLTFDPTGEHVYIADTGANMGFFGWNYSNPSTIYRFDVQEDGTFTNRMTFAYVTAGVPDGVHCDSNGYVYAGCGDGVHVWNKAGTLIGKIYLGSTTANFQFAGDGRMVIAAETKLFYATLAAKGAPLE